MVLYGVPKERSRTNKKKIEANYSIFVFKLHDMTGIQENEEIIFCQTDTFFFMGIIKESRAALNMYSDDSNQIIRTLFIILFQVELLKSWLERNHR